jgi:PKD repeat protein
MKNWLISSLILLFATPLLFAQQINKAEYFFDSDPGYGNGVKITFTAADSVNLTENIMVPANMAGGLHHLYIRVQNNQGTWSMTEVYHIFAQPAHQSLTTLEYFFDSDPGFGNGIKTILTLADSINLIQNITIPQTLTGGLHTLFVRTRNEQGTWSIPEVYHFVAQPGSQSLSTMEYFFDTDPGQGHGTAIPFSPHADSINSIQNIPVPNLSMGSHTLYTRTKNENQVWSFAEPHKIQICTVYGAVSNFSYYIIGNEVFFTDASINSLGRRWLFGDNTTDTTFNPRHVFTGGNNYTVSLITNNICGNDTLSQVIGISGIQSVYPANTATTGLYIGYVYGIGFAPGSTVTWSKAGAPDIHADTTIFVDQNSLKVIFKNFNEIQGKYDISVQVPGSGVLSLQKVISLETPVSPDIWVRLDGRKEVLKNRWATFHVVFGNKGNQAAIEVPLIIKLPGTIQAKMIDRVVNTYEFPSIKPFLPEGRFYRTYDSIANDTVLIGAFILPYIEGGGTGSLTLDVKAPDLTPFYIQAGAQKPWLDETAFINGKEMNNGSSFCDPPACAKCLFDLLGFTPVACVPAVYSYFCKINDLIDVAKAQKKSATVIMLDLIGNGSGMMLSCLGGSATGIIKKVAEAVDQATTGFSAAENCINCRPIPIKSDTIKVRLSFDPNIKAGPSGYNTQNYTNCNDPFVYSIHFENQSSATAPASEVKITDYLDASKLDLSTLRFTGFGFADTNVFYSIPESQVVHDIDLRPAKNSIVRVISSIDSVNKLNFSFTSFDPATMKLTTSIDDGFLNPNVNGTEGLGYVSYQVNSKPGLTTGTIINNDASIIFDNNAPIVTNVWFNGIDKEKPDSHVLPDIQKLNDSTFKISWTGTDAHAGIFYYRIMVSENDGLYSQWLATDARSGRFVTKKSITYRFYSIAEDYVGNIEYDPASPDLILSNTAGIEQKNDNHNFTLYPNPTNGVIAVSGIKEGDKLNLFAADGKLIAGRIAGTEIETFDLAHKSPGIYFLTIITKTGKVQTLKIVKN